MNHALTANDHLVLHGTSDYDRVGGYVTVNAVVDDLCDRVLRDPHLVPFFGRTEPRTLHRSQMRLMTHVLGGPGTLTGDDLRSAYGGAVVPSSVFGRVAEYQVASLRHASVPQDVVIRAVMALVPIERNVVTPRY